MKTLLLLVLLQAPVVTVPKCNANEVLNKENVCEAKKQGWVIPSAFAALLIAISRKEDDKTISP
jgi:hypothetical protein